MEYAQMFIGSQTSMDNFFSSSLMMFIMNVCVIFIFNDAVLILTRSWKRTLIATSVIITVFSIINSYVVLFHGSPITISDIYNVSTALNVLGGYTIYLTDYLVNEIALMCFEFLLIFLLDEKNDTRISIRQIVVHFGIIIVAILSVVGYVKLKEIRIGWGWRSAIEEYGYSLYAISDVLQEANKYICPDGYDADNITVANVEYKSSMDEYPDIILILNESFCNLEYYTDINADCNYLGDFYSVEGAVYGYAEVPGGGTNNSEFELLTSKSMYLLTSSAPFNYVDFTKAKSSVVQYIGNLGYVTSGMHVSKTNYSRHRAYPALGFDTVLLGEDFFTENKYGNRAWSDASMYEDMINCYNDNLSDNPQFIYLLTYQNHGGYEQNDDDMDTVHTLNDYGGITDDVNEYLSSIAMSATAFKELTNYFSSVERDVIICMVGDHAPAFIDELPYINGDDGDMKIIDEKMVPYVMWSNYGLDFSACTEYVSMVDIVPLIIESAGLPMTSFYQTILNIHEEIPIRCSDGTYVDNDGVVGMYGNDSIYYEMMTQYYYMEYNSLVGGGDYREELFLPTP
jgi:hypothetical protein